VSNAILLHGVRLGDPTARVPVAPPVPQQWHGSARRQCVATGSPRRGATWPTARHLRRAPHQPKQEQAGQDVQDHAGEVVPAGVKPKELNVRHMGQPRKRMPIAGVWRGEGPLQAGCRQTRPHRCVLRHVVRIVELLEVVAPNRGVGGEGGRSQHQHDRRGQEAFLAGTLGVSRGGCRPAAGSLGAQGAQSNVF